jgi:hypothetical protein
MPIFRRQGLKAAGLAVASAGLAKIVAAEPPNPLFGPGAHALEALKAHLSALPRRRDFKTVPMILDQWEQWDAQALDTVLHYPGGPKQSWDNTDLTGPWLNVMRNSINAQVFAFRHPDFLCVSATHGSAHLALYDDAMWDKYSLAKLAGGPVTHNSFAALSPAAAIDPKDYQNPDGAFSAKANGIQALQQRGAVFLACHNAIWELAGRLIDSGTNPDKFTAGELCAELTNHLIPDVILTPGAVATLAELSRAGFAYVR